MSLILIVDDKEENRYLLQSLLTEQEHKVIHAIHGVDALEKARQSPPDLIIADILMPVMDGFTLCREWKKDERLKRIPFIFYTATYTDERDRKFALGLGADCFLVKPIDPEDFLNIVQETLQETFAPSATQTKPEKIIEEEESVYLKQYNEVLIRKLEDKVEQLDKFNIKLEQELAERKNEWSKSVQFNQELERLVTERTEQLQKTIAQLEELNSVFTGRELKMAELKKRIKELEVKEKRGSRD
ncbi:MAG: response regulator [Syntrophaceae bacterium]|nr:response regulator [Syntrophaceae bacterium]